MRTSILILLCTSGTLAAQNMTQRAPREREVAPTDSGFSAQRARRRAVESSLEASQITLAGGALGLSGHVRFEGLIVPHLFLMGEKWAFDATPKMVVRMLSEESAPVRSPSFMPRVTVYRTFGKNDAGDRQLDAMYLTISHHSNGQDGPFYLDEARRTINAKSGSFSTNFLELAYLNFGRAMKDEDPIDVGLKVGMRVHVPINENEELRTEEGSDQYGRYRLLLAGQSSYRTARVGYATEYMLDRKVGNMHFFTGRRFIGSVSIAWVPEGWRDVGLFAQYYHGQDYYNIQYRQRVKAVRAGITVRSVSSLMGTDP